MAKIQIKSEKLTPFGGIFSIMEQFDSILSSVIDSTLGLRCKSFGYRYSEIIRSLMSIYFCGGSCIENVTTHLMNHLSLHPTLRTCSSMMQSLHTRNSLVIALAWRLLATWLLALRIAMVTLLKSGRVKHTDLWFKDRNGWMVCRILGRRIHIPFKILSSTHCISPLVPSASIGCFRWIASYRVLSDIYGWLHP